jgi:hypothetical protein
MSRKERRAKAIADEAAADMRRQLEGLTPADIADMGWPDLTADELVASEWQCWFDEEMAA